MNIIKKIRSRIVLSAIASSCVFSLSFASDTTQLAGKSLENNRDLLNSVMQGRSYVVEVDSLGKIKQVVDAGANGSGKDGSAPVANPSANAESTKPVGASSTAMPVNYQGQDAIDYIGTDLPKIASEFGFTPDKLKELLLTDSAIRIDQNKAIFYIDNSADSGQQSGVDTAAGIIAKGAAANSPELPIGLTPNTTNPFNLHSKPGASKTIYLDFDGHVATKTAWSPLTTINAPAYDLDGNPAVFNDNELANIVSIWSRVAEDYIPFDVDVTTKAPPEEDLLRANLTDNNYGTRVVITKTGTINCYCGGVAYVGVVSKINNTANQPAWVFQQALANNEKYIAEAVAHEAGHTLGLFHDGQTKGTTLNSYYSGHGTGTTGWSPIMGVGYYKNVTQWSGGAYPGANNKQDDLTVLATNGFVTRPDDVGNTFATAGSLTNAASGTSAKIQTSGVIESQKDIDMFRIDTVGGLINFTVKPFTKAPNLDTKITLFRANGTTVAMNAPETELSSSISATVPSGLYYLAVAGSAHAASKTDYGFPTYGSLGQYQITGSYTTSGVPATPVAILTSSTLAGPSSLPVNFSAKSSVGKGNIIGYQWSFGDGTYSSSATLAHTYANPGTYTATLSVTNHFLLTHSASAQIVVTPPPLVTLHASSLGLNIIKNSNRSAQIAVTVVDDKNRLVPNAVVKGNWSGAFSGAVNIKTGANGIAIQSANAIPLIKSGPATFTLTGIELTGYVYKPELNAKSIATISW